MALFIAGNAAAALGLTRWSAAPDRQARVAAPA